MMVRAFRFLEAVSRKTEALCVFHFQSISTYPFGCFDLSMAQL
jgi:hypothetical protein